MQSLWKMWSSNTQDRFQLYALGFSPGYFPY